MNKTIMHQTCYSYTFRELAEKLGLPVTPRQWVIVEIDENTVDVMVREKES
jgi:hypothetical protein